MDIVYLIAAGALWAVAIALALGCESLQRRKPTP